LISEFATYYFFFGKIKMFETLLFFLLLFIDNGKKNIKFYFIFICRITKSRKRPSLRIASISISRIRTEIDKKQRLSCLLLLFARSLITSLCFFFFNEMFLLRFYYEKLLLSICHTLSSHPFLYSHCHVCVSV
jgi:hypothetical protein